MCVCDKSVQSQAPTRCERDVGTSSSLQSKDTCQLVQIWNNKCQSVPDKLGMSLELPS
jgi:hypothetical protein